MNTVFLENSLKAMEKNAEYGGQPEILALVHVIERPITVCYETQTKAPYLENFLLIALALTFFIMSRKTSAHSKFSLA